MTTPEAYGPNRPTGHDRKRPIEAKEDFFVLLNGVEVGGLTKKEKALIEFLIGKEGAAFIEEIREAGIVIRRSPNGFTREVSVLNGKLKDQGVNLRIFRATPPGEANPSYILKESIEKEDK